MRNMSHKKISRKTQHFQKLTQVRYILYGRERQRLKTPEQIACVLCLHVQKHSHRGVLRKTCSENMQQIYRRTPMPKCDLNKVACNFIEMALGHGCFPVNLLHISRVNFPTNTSGRLFLYVTLFRMYKIDTATEIELDTVLKMTLEHVETHRFKRIIK